MAPLPPCAYNRAAARTSAAGTPVIGSTASGLVSMPEMNWAHSSNPSHRSPMNDWSIRPSVTTTCAMALTTATFVPGFNCRWWSASMCGERTRSMRRGSTTMSFAPWRSRCFILDAKTGCPSVGLAPITMMTSACATDLKSCVPADSPNVCLSPYPVGEWHTRAHVALFVGAPRRGAPADRSRAVPLLDVEHPTGDGTDRLVPLDLTPRVGDLLANHRAQHPVRVRCVAEREPPLDTRVALVGAAILVGHHADHLVTAHLRLERAADAAVGARGDH